MESAVVHCTQLEVNEFKLPKRQESENSLKISHLERKDKESSNHLDQSELREIAQQYQIVYSNSGLSPMSESIKKRVEALCEEKNPGRRLSKANFTQLAGMLKEQKPLSSRSSDSDEGDRPKIPLASADEEIKQQSNDEEDATPMSKKSRKMQESKRAQAMRKKFKRSNAIQVEEPEKSSGSDSND